jgi:hypothetical protein
MQEKHASKAAMRVSQSCMQDSYAGEAAMQVRHVYETCMKVRQT